MALFTTLYTIAGVLIVYATYCPIETYHFIYELAEEDSTVKRRACSILISTIIFVLSVLLWPAILIGVLVED